MPRLRVLFCKQLSRVEAMSGVPIYQLVFSTHVIKRMFERGISRANIRHILIHGEVIREYPDDTPYPSQLVLGWLEKRPLHIVIAIDAQFQKIYIITAYEPDTSQWELD